MKTFFLILCLVTLSAASAEPAQINVHVFLKGLPVNQITVQSGEQSTTTNDYGFAQISLAPGQHKLAFKSKKLAIFDHDIELADGELVQLLVDLKVIDKHQPEVYTESSVDHLETTPDASAETTTDTTVNTLSGEVKSLETLEPVANAKIFVSGQSGYLQTNDLGQFSTELPTGTYGLSILHSQLSSHVEKSVQVGPNQSNTLTIELTPSGSELPEFVVVEPYIEGSLAAVLEQRRSNNSVANYLSMEQISKAGDSTAAGALKRVTGLTLVDGQFIFIRGLGERYSSTLLNDANMPSPDPTRRVVPLDLFPTGIIGSIEVQKGYSAKLPAEFGGGSVSLKTISIPDEPFFDVGLSYKHNSQSTGKTGFSYTGGGDDWTGYDDGTRAIPDRLAEAIAGGKELRPNNPFFDGGFTREELAIIGRSLNNTYDLKPTSLDPGLGLDIAGGTRFNLDSGQSFGISAAFEYGDEWDYRQELRRDYVVSTGDDLALDSEALADTTERQINASGFLTGGISFNDDHSLSANLMLLRNTTDFTEIAEGFNEDLGNSRRIYEIRWTERDLQSLQLFGNHNYPAFSDLQFDWQYTDSTATFSEPDNRIYRYDRRSDGIFVFSSRNDSNSRVYRELEDDSQNIKYDLTLPLTFNNQHDITVGFGQHWIKKDRQSDIRRFLFEDVGSLANQADRTRPLSEILNDQFIAENGYQLIETTRSTDNYFASLDNKATYYNVDYAYDDFLRISLGARREDFSQSVTTFRLFDPDESPITSSLADDSWFPAFSSTYLWGEHQFRINYSETATRPDFKELSPAQFKDPVLNRNVIGNPDLEVGTIEHYDMRWDYYFSDAEFISLSLFYKTFDKPIEMTILPGSTRIISFQNAKAAENYGFELEFYKDFSWLNSRLSNFYMSTNLAYIESEIQLSTEVAGGQTNNTRPLQGQSPYVVNVQIGYQNESRGIDASILFNEFGERISEAGTSGRPDVYEQPFRQVDFVYSHQLTPHWKVSFKAQNLLDEDVLFLQGDETSRRYKKGRDYSLGISYQFF